MLHKHEDFLHTAPAPDTAVPSEQPSVPPAPLPDPLCALHSYNLIATQHVTLYLHPTCMLHSSFTEFVWGVVYLIQNTWFNRRFSVTLEFCVILAKQDLKSMESRHKTESTFKTHSEQTKHGHNVTKQICPEGIRTVITSHPYNTAPGTWSRLLRLNPD